ILTRYPSGCDFATVFQAATPIVAEFSTRTAWPRRSLSLSASNRLTKSGLPPAGVPVTILSARVGHCWAAAGTASVAASAAAKRRGSVRMRKVIAARVRQGRRDRDGRLSPRAMASTGASPEEPRRQTLPCPGAQGPLGGLSLVPELVHFLERRRLRGLAPFSQGPFDRAEAALKFLICGTQRCLRINPKMAGEVDHREQEVADLGPGGGTIAGSELGLDLVRLLADLGQHRERVVPIEPDLAGFGLQLERTGEGRERERDAGKRACGFFPT